MGVLVFFPAGCLVVKYLLVRKKTVDIDNLSRDFEFKWCALCRLRYSFLALKFSLML